MTIITEERLLNLFSEILDVSKFRNKLQFNKWIILNENNVFELGFL